MQQESARERGRAGAARVRAALPLALRRLARRRLRVRRRPRRSSTATPRSRRSSAAGRRPYPRQAHPRRRDRSSFLDAIEQAAPGRRRHLRGALRRPATGRRLWLTLKTAPRYDADGEIVGGDRRSSSTAPSSSESEEQVRHLLLHDPVSGLANRSLLEDRAGRRSSTRSASAWPSPSPPSASTASTRSSRRSGTTDIDLLLEELGRRLQQAGRAEDTVAYLGSGAFAALLPGAAGPTEATAAVARSARGRERAPGGRTTHELFLDAEPRRGDLPHRRRDRGGAPAQRRRRHAPGFGRAAATAGSSSTRAERGAGGPAGARRRAAPRPRGRPVLPGVPAAGRHRDRGDHRRRGARPLAPPRARRRCSRWTSSPSPRTPASSSPSATGSCAEACTQGRAWHRQFGKPLRMAVNISARQLHDETLRRHGAAHAARDRVRRPRARARDHRDRGHARRAPHGADPRRPAHDGRARRARRLRHGLLVAQPPRAPADLDRQDRPLVRARPADGARARRRGRLGDRPRPPPGSDGRGRGRRDHRRARRSARRRLRRHPGLPVQPAAPRRECTDLLEARTISR